MYRQDERENNAKVMSVKGEPYDDRAHKSERRRVKRTLFFVSLILPVILICAGVPFLLHDGGEPVSPGQNRQMVQDNVIMIDSQAVENNPVIQDGNTVWVSQPVEGDRGTEGGRDIMKREPEQEPFPGEEVIVLTENEHPPRIAIDPGHGGEDAGCSGNGVLEKEINLEIAVLLETRLQELGYETLLLGQDDKTQQTQEERVRQAEKARADLYVSIHQNAGAGNASASGIETWYCGDTEGSRRLAQLVHKGAVEKTGAVDRKIKETEDDEAIGALPSAIPSCRIDTGFLTNREECAALSSAEYQEKLAAGIAQGIDYYYNPKIMYLTFDDGPSKENTAVVLDILKARNIKATFFLVGENVQRYPEMAKRIAEEGHTIGIHCYRHDYKELYKSVDAYLEDFQKAYDIVLETTGVEAKLFRFPGGSINSYNKEVYQDIAAAMTEKGYIYYDWNASVLDAVKQSTPEQLLKNGIETTRGRKKVVMLCHDVIYNTTQCLEELLDSLPEYKMELLTPEVEPVQF